MQDNSAKGFRSAANNAQTYQKTMQQVQDQLFPIQNALKGGMFAGASLTGIGLLTSNFNTLGTTLQGVTSQFSGLGNVLGNFSANLSPIQGNAEKVNNEFQTTTPLLVRLGTAMLTVSGTAYTLIEASAKGYVTFKTLYSAITPGISAFRNMIAAHREYASVCSRFRDEKVSPLTSATPEEPVMKRTE